MCPDTRQEVCLQFQANAQMFGFDLARFGLQLLNLHRPAKQVLNMVPDLVRDDVGACKITGGLNSRPTLRCTPQSNLAGYRVPPRRAAVANTEDATHRAAIADAASPILPLTGEPTAGKPQSGVLDRAPPPVSRFTDSGAATADKCQATQRPRNQTSPVGPANAKKDQKTNVDSLPRHLIVGEYYARRKPYTIRLLDNNQAMEVFREQAAACRRVAERLVAPPPTGSITLF